MIKLFGEKDLKLMSVNSFFKRATVYKQNGVFKFVVLDLSGNKYSILKFGTVKARTFVNVHSIYKKLLELDVYEFSFIDKDRKKELSNA
jgi:hypothetical protein